MTREELYNLIKTKTDDMRKSQLLRDHFRHFFKDNKDVDTFATWIKKVVECPTKPGIVKRFKDPNFTTQLVEDETAAFYYTLDQMTNGKYKLLQKVTEQEKYITHIPSGRGSCGTNPEIDANGQEKVVKHIIVSDEAFVNSRTIKMHELWHAIDEKNYTLSTTHYSNQFFGEIGTMAIDYMGSEFIKSLHPEDKQLCDQLSYLQNEAKYNDTVDKARDGYLDYLLGKILIGTPEEQEKCLNEVVDGIGKYWGLQTLEHKVQQIDAFVRDPQKNHYDPMYECRYVPATAIVFELRKSKLSAGEKIAKLAQLNEHLLSIDSLAKDGETNEWNIITTHLEIPSMEQVMDNLTTIITKANSSTSASGSGQNQTSSSSPMLP